MFDRFTDRARKVMGLARQEAQRFNHEYIGTEHVLLGLVQMIVGIWYLLQGLPLLAGRDNLIYQAYLERRLGAGPAALGEGLTDRGQAPGGHAEGILGGDIRVPPGPQALLLGLFPEKGDLHPWRMVSNFRPSLRRDTARRGA